MKENKNDLNKQVSSEQLEDVSGGVICWDSDDEVYDLYDNNYNFVKSSRSDEELENLAQKNGYDDREISYLELAGLREAQRAKSK